MKIILIFFTAFFLTFYSHAQTSYFKNISPYNFCLAGGGGKTEGLNSSFAGAYLGIKRFQIGVQYETGIMTYENLSAHYEYFIPSIEYVFFRNSFLGISGGISYLQLTKTNVVFPMEISAVFDPYRKSNGFVLMPEISLGKLLVGGGGPEEKNILGEFGIVAMFRQEDGISIILRPAVSGSTGTNETSYTLTIGIVFN